MAAWWECRSSGDRYWGGGWYYPYPVTYSYDTGTLIMEMVDLRQPVDQSNQTNCLSSGMLMRQDCYTETPISICS